MNPQVYIHAHAIVAQAWLDIIQGLRPFAEKRGVSVEEGLVCIVNRLGGAARDTVFSLPIPDLDKITFKQMLLTQFRLGMAETDAERDLILAESSKESDGQDPLRGVSNN